MSYGNVIISFLKIISWYFSSLFIKGFAFLQWINIFERLGLDSRKKIPKSSISALRKKNHKFYHLEYNRNTLVMYFRHRS